MASVRPDARLSHGGLRASAGCKRYRRSRRTTSSGPPFVASGEDIGGKLVAWLARRAVASNEHRVRSGGGSPYIHSRNGLAALLATTLHGFCGSSARPISIFSMSALHRWHHARFRLWPALSAGKPPRASSWPR